MLTHKHLKYFRRHFTLTQTQAARLCRVKKEHWVACERGLAKISPALCERIKTQSNRLSARLERTKNKCQRCSKNITSARKNGWTHCPYCSRPIRFNTKKLINTILPKNLRGLR